MAVKKNDFIFLIISLFFVAVMVLVIGNQGTFFGLYAIVGIMGIVMVMTIVIRPSLGANILIFAIFTNISTLLTNRGYPGLIKPLVVVVFAAIMVRNFYTGQIPKGRAKTARIEVFLIFYLLTVIVSYLAASDKERAFTAIQDLVKDIGIIYTILFAIRNSGDWKQAMWVVILTTAFVSLFGLYQVITGNYGQDFFGLATNKVDGSDMRLGGPIEEPNMWGQVVVAIIPLVIFRVLHEQRMIVKVVSVGILGILLMELFSTYSRGAYLALAVSMLMILFVFERGLDLRLAFAALGVIILILPLLPSAYLQRFSSLASLSPSTTNGIYQDDSFRGRTSEILTGLSIIARNPIFGVGVGNFPNNYQKYAQEIGLEFRSEERDAHSLYIQIMAETGLFGIIAFVGIIGSLFTALSRTIKSIEHLSKFRSWYPWINSLRVGLIGYLVAATFLHGAYIRFLWILVALSMTAIQLIAEEIKTGEKTIFTPGTAW